MLAQYAFDTDTLKSWKWKRAYIRYAVDMDFWTVEKETRLNG
jgi:hypothetical protein